MRNDTADETSRSFNTRYWISKWLTNLPKDLRILIELVNDRDIPAQASALAAGVVIYVLSPVDLILDKLPLIGYLDDVFVIRVGLEIVMALCSEEKQQYYKSKYPETFERFDEQTALLRDFLKGLYDLLRSYVQKLTEKRHRGKKATEIAKSSVLREQLFDDVMEKSANYTVDRSATDRLLASGAIEEIVPLLDRALKQK